jgi:hypothetical protein
MKPPLSAACSLSVAPFWPESPFMAAAGACSAGWLLLAAGGALELLTWGAACAAPAPASASSAAKATVRCEKFGCTEISWLNEKARPRVDGLRGGPDMTQFRRQRRPRLSDNRCVFIGQRPLLKRWAVGQVRLHDGPSPWNLMRLA